QIASIRSHFFSGQPSTLAYWTTSVGSACTWGFLRTQRISVARASVGWPQRACSGIVLGRDNRRFNGHIVVGPCVLVQFAKRSAFSLFTKILVLAGQCEFVRQSVQSRRVICFSSAR